MNCIFRTESNSSLNNLLFGSLYSELDKPDNSYVFMLSGGTNLEEVSSNSDAQPDSQLFGICVLLTELVKVNSLNKHVD